MLGLFVCKQFGSPSKKGIITQVGSKTRFFEHGLNGQQQNQYRGD